MPFLIEVTGRHRVTLDTRIFRFTDLPGGYNTAPGDDPANAHFQPRILQAGLYRRTLFGSGGRTSGVAEVDRGAVALNNADGGLDEMLGYAFDGYPLTIWQIADKRSAYASKVRLTTATIEQPTVDWEEVHLALRSRLAVLDVPIQDETYAGTTVDGTQRTAEGFKDLKGAPRLLLFGRVLNIPALLLNARFGVYGLGQRFAEVISVRDRGSRLTATGQDFPTLAALVNATIADGRWATCRALGLIRIGGNIVPAGPITVEVAEGNGVTARTAGQVARRILVEQAGLVPGVDFLDEDIAALDAAAPYEVGYWTGTQRVTTLAVLSMVLDSVRGWISPDRNGVFRIGQFRAPAGSPKRTFGRTRLLDDEGSGLRRLPTGDDGRGLPAKKIVVQHSYNHAVAARDTLAGATRENDPAFVAFSEEEWRQTEASSEIVADLHKLAPEMIFQTCLVRAADAEIETAERQALYGVQRDHYAVSLRTEATADLDLDDVVNVEIDRFGMSAGRAFRVVGSTENHEDNMTTLDLWG